MSLFPAYEHPDTASNTLPFNSVLIESSSTDVSRETFNFQLSNVSRETLHYLKGLSASGFVLFDRREELTRDQMFHVKHWRREHFQSRFHHDPNTARNPRKGMFHVKHWRREHFQSHFFRDPDTALESHNELFHVKQGWDSGNRLGLCPSDG
jgi:hypothetical protein